MKDSTEFVKKIDKIALDTNNIHVGFDMVSLSTILPLVEILELPEDISTLFEHCLATTYFLWNMEFYEQLDGVAMGSLLSFLHGTIRATSTAVSEEATNSLTTFLYGIMEKKNLRNS